MIPKSLKITAISIVAILVAAVFISFVYFNFQNKRPPKEAEPQINALDEVSRDDFYDDVGGYSYRDTAEDYIYEVLIIKKDKIIIAPAFSDYMSYLKINKIFKYSNETYKVDVQLEVYNYDSNQNADFELNEPPTNLTDSSSVLNSESVFISKDKKSITVGDEIYGTEYIYCSKDEKKFYDHLWKTVSKNRNR